MTVTLGVLALVEAKPGKEAEVEAFLQSGRAIVEQEPARLSGTPSGSMDRPLGSSTRLPTRQADRRTSRARSPALAQVGSELLAKDPDIRLVDVLAVK